MRLLREVIRLKGENQISLNCSDATGVYNEIRDEVRADRKRRGEIENIGETYIRVRVSDFTLPDVDDDPSASDNYRVIVKDYKGKVIDSDAFIEEVDCYDFGDYGDMD